MHRLALVLLLVVPFTGASAHASTDVAFLRGPVWSPDGTRLAYVLERGGLGRVYVVDFTGRNRHAVGPRQPWQQGLTWAPDGSALAYVSGRQLWRLDLATGAATQLTSRPNQDLMQPAWSPDGRTIAYTLFEGCFRCTTIHGIAPDGTDDRVVVPNGKRAKWSHDGRTLLTSSPVQLVDVATGQATVIDQGGFYASWAGDGETIVFSGVDGLELTAPGRIAPPRVLIRSRKEFVLPELNPFGTRVAWVRGWRVLLRRVSGGPIVTLPRSESANTAPAWSFRGALAYVADGVCGPQSEIDVARPDGSRPHPLAKTCRL